MSLRASAPGKVLWAGEYAVLEGAAAVVMAVEQTVVAEVVPWEPPLSPFLAAVRDEIRETLGAGAEATRAAHIRVDSSALSQDGRKLGLGSSAAATVAAAAAAMGETGTALHALAHRAHARAQAALGARGSGADIAASVHGGLLEVRRPAGAGDDSPLVTRALTLPGDLDFALVWTGAPADTPSLVARVRALQDRDARAHVACMAGLARAAGALINALDQASATAVVSAIAAGAVALAELAARSQAPLLPPSFSAVAALAAAHGGAAKPTGAGGGDLILAVFPGKAESFRAAARAAGMILVTTGVGYVGVTLA